MVGKDGTDVAMKASGEGGEAGEEWKDQGGRRWRAGLSAVLRWNMSEPASVQRLHRTAEENGCSGGNGAVPIGCLKGRMRLDSGVNSNQIFMVNCGFSRSGPRWIDVHCTYIDSWNNLI